MYCYRAPTKRLTLIASLGGYIGAYRLYPVNWHEDQEDGRGEKEVPRLASAP
jgi:hypothetical protein